MKKNMMLLLLLSVCAVLLFGCKGKEQEEEKGAALEIEVGSHFFNKLEKTGESVPEESIEKVETGIQNWAKSTLGADDTFSNESKEIIDDKFYEIIVSPEQCAAVKEEREAFYKDASVSTESVEVEVKNTSEAQYQSQTIGIVECAVTVSGIRNGEAFEKVYDLTLSMDYQHEIASVYEVGNIELK